MKNLIICLFLFVTFFVQAQNYNNNDHFWIGDKIVSITNDKSSLVIIFRQDKITLNQPQLYKDLLNISEVEISDDQRMAVLSYSKEQNKSEIEIIESIGINIENIEWYSFCYLANGIEVLKPTNKISFKLMAGRETIELEPFIKNRAVLDKTYFGTPQLKILRPDLDIITLSNEIYESGLVEYCHPDFIANIVPTEDPLFIQQYFLNNYKQMGGSMDIDIDATQAWDITKGTSTIKVAVIDDGVEVHDDLKDVNGLSKIIGGFTPLNGGNGGPFSTGKHGEACAGIIAASHNEINTRGVAPNIKLITVNILATGTTNDQVADGINWARQNGADVLSNSWGYQCNANGFTWPAITTAITNARTLGRSGKGCVVVFSAGNNYPTDNCGYGPAGYIGFPSTVSGVLCVSATNKDGNIASYSSRGSRIDITALGGESDIRTLDRMGNYGYNTGNDMSDFGGTSAACPQVSGVAALILSLNPNLTEQQVKDLITNNATDMGAAGKDDLFGWGRLDAAKSVAAAYLTINPGYVFNEQPLNLTTSQLDYWVGFQASPAPGIAPGMYRCDRYLANKTFSNFVQMPIGWLIAPEGYSIANPNICIGWSDKISTSSSVEIKTYFYFIKYGVGGNVNQWVPYDPNPTNLRKAGSLGIPLVAPVISNLVQNPTPVCRNATTRITSTLSQGNGTLTYIWTLNDAPAGSQIYPHGSYCDIFIGPLADNIEAPVTSVTLSVSNDAGESILNRTVYINNGCSGCPTLAFEQNENLVDENTLLVTSLSNPDKDVTDYYLINTLLTPVNNRINLTVHEPQTEHTWFDNFSLFETRANPDETIVVNDEGQVINYKGILPARIMLNGNIDVTENLLSMDSVVVKLYPGDEISITRNVTEGDGDVVLGGEEPPVAKDRPALLLNVLKESKIIGEDEKTVMEKVPITNFYFRPNRSIISKKLRNLPTGTIQITVNKELTLDYFVFVTDLRTARTRELSLVSAVHNVNGDIKSKLTTIDQNYAEMFPTERIDLSFSTTTNSGNRAYILKTVGRYETDTTFVAKQNNLAKLNEQPIIPTENKLYDNYPNPFNPSTIIKYSLKDDGKVILKIYNSLGEEVRTLVNEIKPAGNYEVEFNASNLPSGVYIYSIQSGEFVSSKKMILLK